MSQGDAEPTCKISQGDAELKGFAMCCWCCAAPAAPRSAILPKKIRARPFPIARKRKNENKRLTGASTLVLFIRSRDVAAITAAVLLLL